MRGELVRNFVAFLFAVLSSSGHAQIAQRVIDVPTRPGVTQRLLILAAPDPKATVLLFAGGHGGLQVSPSGSFKWGAGNFLIRTRQLFADQGLMVVVVDAPSDRQSAPFLAGFRQRPEHAADIKRSLLGRVSRRRFRYGLWARAAARNRRRSSPPSSADPRVRTDLS